MAIRSASRPATSPRRCPWTGATWSTNPCSNMAAGSVSGGCWICSTPSGVAATFCCCGQALERNPAAGRAMVERGHDICGHGYRWAEAFKMDRATEQADIRQDRRHDQRDHRTASAGLAEPLCAEHQYPRSWLPRRVGFCTTATPIMTICPTLPEGKRQALAGRPLYLGYQRCSRVPGRAAARAISPSS